MIESIQIEFVVPSGNSLQALISIVKILNFSSAIQTECTVHAFPTLHRRGTLYEPTNERVYNSATEWNTIPNDLKKNLTWANTDFNWLALQSKCLQDDPTKSE